MTARSTQITTLAEVFTCELHLAAHLADALVIGATTITTKARAGTLKAGSYRPSLNCSVTTRRGLHQM